ncbi:MAG: sulfate transporter [Alphaproteobacteria bacterium]|nr:sulfate transporter [Alphaproteobacteria bacterium]
MPPSDRSASPRPTSTDNSGLFQHLLPAFERATGIRVHVIAVGTGAALEIGARGDADVVLVHARVAEDAFVAAGHGVDRRDVMYNDLVFVGPRADPAGVRGLRDAGEALRRIAASQSRFVSRGDDSGTHKAELALWMATGTDPRRAAGAWYLETGAGMSGALNTASGKDAYALTDRATWLQFRNRGTLETLVEGDPRLFNPYGVILVNPARHPHVKHAEGIAFMDWLGSREGQAMIKGFKIEGRTVFFPGADPARRPGS